MTEVEAAILSGENRLAELQAFWPPLVSLASRTQSAVHQAYPYLLSPAFTGVADVDLRVLSLGLRLVSDSMAAGDSLIDRPKECDTTSVSLIVQALQFEAYNALYTIIPADRPFWNRFREYYANYARICLLERTFEQNAEEWARADDAMLVDIARGKGSLARTVVAGLVELAGDESLLACLAESVDLCQLGTQHFDDLQDWRDDLLRGVPTRVLRRLIPTRPQFANESERDAALSAYAKELFYGGLAREALDEAIATFEKAHELTKALPVERWHRRIARCQQRCELMLGDIKRIIRTNRQRALLTPIVVPSLPSPANACQEIALDALRWLLDEWKKDFGEARHVIDYPREFDPDSSRAAQFGDVFPRALIAEALCDADDALAGQLGDVISRELKHLVMSHRSDEIGGWTHFPNLMELPPSTDVFAQVLRLLVRRGQIEGGVKPIITRLLGVVLDHCSNDDGSFESWMIRRTDGDLEKLHRDACQRLWGTGPDLEIVANLTCALVQFDRDRFLSRARSATSWMLQLQRPRGHWTGRRKFYGPFYATFTALRALCAVDPDSESIARAAEFIRQSQHNDGGWGMKGSDESNAEDSALALLCFGLISSARRGVASDRQPVQAGMKFLKGQQGDDGSWPGRSFMLLGGITYGSRSIATAFGLRAALACERILEHGVFASQFE